LNDIIACSARDATVLFGHNASRGPVGQQNQIKVDELDMCGTIDKITIMRLLITMYIALRVARCNCPDHWIAC